MNMVDGLKLDRRDLELLYCLDIDATSPSSAIAKRLRISKEAVLYRLKRLERLGVILSYNAVIDHSALGYPIGGGFRIKFQYCNQKIEDEIIGYFKSKDNVWWLISRSGDYDLGVAIWARDIHEFYCFFDEFLGKHRQHVSDIKPRIYHKTYQYTRAYLAPGKVRPENEQPIVCWNAPRKPYDQTDYSILKVLSTNARMPVVEIARELELTPAVVKYRIKKMEKQGIILGYKAILSLEKLGYYWYKIELSLNDFSRKKALFAYCRAHPNVVYAYEAVGGEDFEMEVEVKDARELLAIINDIRDKFSGSIISYNYYLWDKEHKIRYLGGPS